MNRVVLDPATAAALKSAAPGIELCTADGQPVGAFVPSRLIGELSRFLDERRQAIDEANAAISLEELQAIDAAGGEVPHEEVCERLGLK